MIVGLSFFTLGFLTLGISTGLAHLHGATPSCPFLLACTVAITVTSTTHNAITIGHPTISNAIHKPVVITPPI